MRILSPVMCFLVVAAFLAWVIARIFFPDIVRAAFASLLNSESLKLNIGLLLVFGTLSAYVVSSGIKLGGTPYERYTGILGSAALIGFFLYFGWRVYGLTLGT